MFTVCCLCLVNKCIWQICMLMHPAAQFGEDAG